jgi:hypothetical protein
MDSPDEVFSSDFTMFSNLAIVREQIKRDLVKYKCIPVLNPVLHHGDECLSSNSGHVTIEKDII